MSRPEPLPHHELIDLVSRQHRLIEELQTTVDRQTARIEELEAGSPTGGRWRKGRSVGASTSVVRAGARVEAILRLAASEAEDIREGARQAAAALVAEAERDAARIRAEAEAAADVTRKEARG